MQLPKDNDTPFSQPHDMPKNMPLDYPELNGNTDIQEAYDEGIEATVEFDPYSKDDNPLNQVLDNKNGEWYTLNHASIRRWAEYRYGHPARLAKRNDDLEGSPLYIFFEDEEPDIEIRKISWKKFFNLFDKNNLVFIFKLKDIDGETSHYYRLMDRSNVTIASKARRLP